MEQINCTGCHKNHQYFKKSIFWALMIVAGAFVRMMSISYTDNTIQKIKEHETIINNLCESMESIRNDIDHLNYFALIKWDEWYEFIVRKYMNTPESVQGTPEQHQEVIRMMLTKEAKEEFIRNQGK